MLITLNPFISTGTTNMTDPISMVDECIQDYLSSEFFNENAFIYLFPINPSTVPRLIERVVFECFKHPITTSVGSPNYLKLSIRRKKIELSLI